MNSQWQDVPVSDISMFCGSLLLSFGIHQINAPNICDCLGALILHLFKFLRVIIRILYHEWKIIGNIIAIILTIRHNHQCEHA